VTLENELDQPLEEVLPIFLQQYYVPGVFIPSEILITADWEPDTRVGEILSKFKGSPVQLVPARDGWGLDLMNMAEKNVLAALKEDIKQTDLLKELQTLLSLKTVPSGTTTRANAAAGTAATRATASDFMIKAINHDSFFIFLLRPGNFLPSLDS